MRAEPPSDSASSAPSLVLPPNLPLQGSLSIQPRSNMSGTTAYICLHDLNDGHSDVVNTLAFSPNGLYLATGSDDASVIIWNATNGAYLYRIPCDSGVDSLLWHPVEEETVIAGCDSGYLIQTQGFTLVSSIVFGLTTLSHHSPERERNTSDPSWGQVAYILPRLSLDNSTIGGWNGSAGLRDIRDFA